MLLGITLGSVILSIRTKFAILSVFGSLIFVLILFKTEIGFLLAVAAIPFEMLGALTALGPSAGFTSVSIIKILALITCLSWLIQKLKMRTEVLTAPQLVVISGLILIAVFSFVFIEAHFEKKAKSYLLSYIIYFGIFFMTLNIVRSKEILKRLIIVLIIVGVAASLFSFVQRWVPAFHGEAKTLYDDIYGLYGAIIDYSEYASLGRIMRTSSGMVGHDMFALFLALVIPLSFYHLEVSKLRLSKIGWMGIMSIQIIALALTYSRGGTLMLLIIFLLMIMRRVVKPSWEKIFISIASVAIISIVVATSTTALDRIFSIGHFMESKSVSARFELMRAGLNMFKDHNYLIGVGMGNFDYNLPEYSDTIPFYYEPNNEFLRVFVEMGIFGLLLSLMLYGLTFRDFRIAQKNYQKKGDLLMCNLAKTLEICFVGFLFFSMTQTTIGRKEWPLVMALAIVLKRLSMRSDAINSKITGNDKTGAT